MNKIFDEGRGAGAYEGRGAEFSLNKRSRVLETVRGLVHNGSWIDEVFFISLSGETKLIEPKKTYSIRRSLSLSYTVITVGKCNLHSTQHANN